MAGGYPPQFEWAVTMLVDRLKQSMDERVAIVRATFAAAQAYAVGALGEFKLSELGYEIPQSGALGEEVEERFTPRFSLYAGKMALWEVGDEGEAPHVLCCHAFRRVYVSDRMASLREDRKLFDELDGRSVMNAASCSNLAFSFSGKSCRIRFRTLEGVVDVRNLKLIVLA